MINLVSGFSEALDAATAAQELAAVVEAAVGGTEEISGAVIFSTAASGAAGVEIGDLLADRWPSARLVGTSFEGIVADGRVLRDRPAAIVLAWAVGEAEPIPLLLESDAFREGDRAVEDLEAIFSEARGGVPISREDLILLFPDALGTTALEPILEALHRRFGGAPIAGAAAVGVAGTPCSAWMTGESEPGGTLALIVPEGAGAMGCRLAQASGSRFASPWLRVGACRNRWIDELDEEPPLDWIRRQLGLEKDAPVAPFLDRLLVRIRPWNGASAGDAEVDLDSLPDESCVDFVERYVIGLDDRTGAISVAEGITRGAELAFALPDPDRARGALREAIAGFDPGGVLLQFACRARDESLYGDADLESAIVAHAAGTRPAVGTVAPFQLGPDADGRSRILVHSTLLAALGTD